MVGLEGPGERAAGNRLHHGGFHFEKALPVEEAANLVENPDAFSEGLHHFGVCDEVEIAVAVAEFHVAQAVKLFRQLAERLGQHLEIPYLQRNLPAPGFERPARHSEDVAEVNHGDPLERFSQIILLEIELEFARSVHQIGKRGFAVAANAHDPPRNRNITFSKFLPFFNDLGTGVGAAERLAVRRKPHALEFSRPLQPAGCLF